MQKSPKRLCFIMILCGLSSTANAQPQLVLEKTYQGFSSPTGIAKDSQNNLYVSNWSRGTISKITPAGEISTIASKVGSPSGLAIDQNDRLYISDYANNFIYRMDKDKKIETFAKGLRTPAGLSWANNGNLLVANRSSNEIVSINPQGEKTVIASNLNTPVAVVEDQHNNLYVTNYAGNINQINPSTNSNTIVTKDFNRPGVGIDIINDTVIAIDNGGGCLRWIDKEGRAYSLIADVNSCVALLIDKDRVYVSSWDTGMVYEYKMNFM